MKKNDLVEVTIEDVNIQGVGIGRIDNMVIFVSDSAIGEKLIVRIIKSNKNYLVGKIEEIVIPSKNRILPDCVHYKKCGGCVFRHLSYEEELKIKSKHILDCLERIGKFKGIEIEPIVKASEFNFYRNKSQVPIRKNENGEIIAGFFANHSHRITDCSQCLLHCKYFNSIIEDFKFWIKKYNISVYDEKSCQGIIRHLYLRYAEYNDEIMVCIVINGKSIPFKKELINLIISKHPKVKSIIINSNLNKTNVILGEKCYTIYGKSVITDEIDNLKFEISPLSFYQVNKKQTEKLYRIVKKLLDLSGNEVVIDMYCGIGTIGLTLANNSFKVIGVEVVEAAVTNAIRNAELNGINNAEFLCSDASEMSKKFENAKIFADFIILDPPRKGCDKIMLENVLKMKPKKIVYVSCDPSTLARDLNFLCRNSFEIKRVIPVDMFPRTAHVETVVLLGREMVEDENMEYAHVN